MCPDAIFQEHRQVEIHGRANESGVFTRYFRAHDEAGVDRAFRFGVRIALLKHVVRPVRVVLLSLSLAVGVACHLAPASERTQPVVRPIDLGSVSLGSLTLPNRATSVKFAVIGDSGRGTPPQHEIAAQMTAFREDFPFAFVLMLGDNIYEGPASRDDYQRKFEEPYRRLLDKGVKFYATLGNHDDPREVIYPLFNMDGERYYSFAPPEDVLAKIATHAEFFAVDSTNLDRAQLRWLDERLGKSSAAWKICFLHHPLYTSGRYRTWARGFRLILEPLLVEHDVDVVFSGHEHIYQRTELQSGIQYFVSGGAGSLRPGDGTPASYVARTFDTDYHFMLIEIDGDALHFQAISRTGATVDAGTLYKDGRDSPTEQDTAAPTRQDTAARR
jgi:predicted phosphodiesterase